MSIKLKAMTYDQLREMLARCEQSTFLRKSFLRAAVLAEIDARQVPIQNFAAPLYQFIPLFGTERCSNCNQSFQKHEYGMCPDIMSGH